MKLLVAVLLVTIAMKAPAPCAQNGGLRLAVGPFFAPPHDRQLQDTAASLPDLLTVELSRNSPFELIERSAVKAIVAELQLSADGMTSTTTVLKLGQVLACDRFVSGTFVSAGKQTSVWVKVIDTRSGVVLDLAPFPVDAPDVSQILPQISSFVASSNLRQKSRHFVALGRFTDVSLTATREDWSFRLRTGIEKHLLAAGYGVVEREAALPIITEHQLQEGGHTGVHSNPIALQPAFWLIEGGTKWVRDTQDKVSITLRIQQLGRQERILERTGLPDTTFEQSIITAVAAALSKGSASLDANAARVEAAAQFDYAMQLATRSAAEAPSRLPDSPEATEHKTAEQYHQTMVQAFEKVLLLDPTHVHAKRFLAMALLRDTDVNRRMRATNLVNELAAESPAMSQWASSILGKSRPAERPAITYRTNRPSAGATSRVRSETRASSNVVQVIPPTWLQVALFEDLSALAYEGDKLLAASGNQLQRYDPQRNLYEPINLPPGCTNSITAITTDPRHWWLGTMGGGLARIEKATGALKVYGEQDGLLMPSITSLALIGDRLWIGFGYRESGGIGYLDLATDKFVGLTSELKLFGAGKSARTDPPESSVGSIRTADEKSLWIASATGLHRYDTTRDQWELTLPHAPALAGDFHPLQRDSGSGYSPALPRYAALTVTTNFIAVGRNGQGLSVLDLKQNRWNEIRLGAAPLDNHVTVVRVDARDKRLVWAGTYGKLSLVDLEASAVVGQCNLVGSGNVLWIVPLERVVSFAVANHGSGSFKVYWMQKPSFLLADAGQE